eukprot:Rhum_TRINITY_DN14847_c28_g1::Rhum_TRINITY_DN14847_c28_g1_i1::g.125810::m.125810
MAPPAAPPNVSPVRRWVASGKKLPEASEKGLQGICPTTGLPLVNLSDIPERMRREFASLFVGEKGYTVVHFFAPCTKMSPGAGVSVKSLKRVLIVGSRAVYVTYPDSDTRRCVAVNQITELFTIDKKEKWVGLSVQNEHGMGFKLENGSDLRAFVRVVTTLSRAATGQDLPRKRLEKKEELKAHLRLQKAPRTWDSKEKMVELTSVRIEQFDSAKAAQFASHASGGYGDGQRHAAFRRSPPGLASLETPPSPPSLLAHHQHPPSSSSAHAAAAAALSRQQQQPTTATSASTAPASTAPAPPAAAAAPPQTPEEELRRRARAAELAERAATLRREEARLLRAAEEADDELQGCLAASFASSLDRRRICDLLGLRPPPDCAAGDEVGDGSSPSPLVARLETALHKEPLLELVEEKLGQLDRMRARWDEDAAAATAEAAQAREALAALDLEAAEAELARCCEERVGPVGDLRATEEESKALVARIARLADETAAVRAADAAAAEEHAAAEAALAAAHEEECAKLRAAAAEAAAAAAAAKEEARVPGAAGAATHDEGEGAVAATLRASVKAVKGECAGLAALLASMEAVQREEAAAGAAAPAAQQQGAVPQGGAARQGESEQQLSEELSEAEEQLADALQRIAELQEVVAETPALLHRLEAKESETQRLDFETREIVIKSAQMRKAFERKMLQMKMQIDQQDVRLRQVRERAEEQEQQGREEVREATRAAEEEQEKLRLAELCEAERVQTLRAKAGQAQAELERYYGERLAEPFKPPAEEAEVEARLAIVDETIEAVQGELQLLGDRDAAVRGKFQKSAEQMAEQERGLAERAAAGEDVAAELEKVRTATACLQESMDTFALQARSTRERHHQRERTLMARRGELVDQLRECSVSTMVDLGLHTGSVHPSQQGAAAAAAAATAATAAGATGPSFLSKHISKKSGLDASLPEFRPRSLGRESEGGASALSSEGCGVGDGAAAAGSGGGGHALGMVIQPSDFARNEYAEVLALHQKQQQQQQQQAIPSEYHVQPQ